MCIIFLASQGDEVLVGNNEDYINPKTKVWYLPPAGGEIEGVSFEGGAYARVYFGYDDFYPQGGMNAAGLCFDGTATPPVPVENSLHKPEYEGNLIDRAMATCATVEEVLALCDRYNLAKLERACLFFGDRTGDSAIIEGDVILRKAGRYQVLTNFYQSQATPGDYPCERYNLAAEMLEASDDISVALFRRILAATHQEASSQTFYSNIYDLKRGIVYLYHFHNFENELLIDPREAWGKGAHAYDLPALFPKTYAATVYDRNHAFERDRDKILEARRSAGEIVALPAEVLERCVGRYRMEHFPDMVVEISRAGERQLQKTTGRAAQELFPTSETRFVSLRAEGDQTYTFEQDETGQAIRVIVDSGNGWVMPAVKIPA